MAPSTDSWQSPWSLSARWVYPVSGPPLADGIVTIASEHIVSVEPAGRRTADRELGDVAILPGLINAHTHLDLTGLRGHCPPSADFTDWLRQVIAHRRAITSEQVEADVRAGLTEGLRHGTTLLGDISAEGGSWPILANAPSRSVVFYELLGLTEKRAEQSLEAARAWLTCRPALACCRPGLSPHAPYSVRVSLFQQVAQLARELGCPLAVHLAESQQELELLYHRRGPFVAFLQDLGVWEPLGLASDLAEVIRVCDPSLSLFVHANYLSPSALLPHNSTVVYCPRTHAAFGHTDHPFLSYLSRGVCVALGTDSLASNPDLSILAEMRYLHRQYADVPGNMLLHMATLSGAQALGWADETGSLEAGKSADLVVVPLAPGSNRDPYERLLESDYPVQQVLCRGRWIQH